MIFEREVFYEKKAVGIVIAAILVLLIIFVIVNFETFQEIFLMDWESGGVVGPRDVIN